MLEYPMEKMVRFGNGCLDQTLHQYLRFVEGPVVRCKASSESTLPKGNNKVSYPEEAKEVVHLQTKCKAARQKRDIVTTLTAAM